LASTRHTESEALPPPRDGVTIELPSPHPEEAITASYDSGPRAVVRLRGGADSSVTLLCVPQAGGGVAAFQRLQSCMPAHVGLCAVRLPGRESRLREPPVRRMDQAVAEILRDLEVTGPAPLALLGYCSGAFIAYEIARRLLATPVRPSRLIVLASPAPRLIAPARWVHKKSQAELTSFVRDSRITADAILNDPDIFEIFELAIRADFETYETWACEPGPPLDTPITVVGAAEDKTVDLDDLLGWRTRTSTEFTLRILPGGHDFLGAGTAAVAAGIGADLAT
jgi:medium-chain acyl-[acyl-carrier-protein] hydrolase